MSGKRLVMLLSPVRIVEPLWSSAEDAGFITPKRPPAISAELNPSISIDEIKQRSNNNGIGIKPREDVNVSESQICSYRELNKTKQVSKDMEDLNYSTVLVFIEK